MFKYDEVYSIKIRAGNAFTRDRVKRKLKWQYKVRDMPKKRLPAIIVGKAAVWEEVTKGRA